MNINPNSSEAYQLFHEGTLALAKAERQGFRVNVKYVEKKMQFITRKINYLEDKFSKSKFYSDWQRSSSKKININSGTQLEYYLYHVLKIQPKKFTNTGKGSTDKDAIALLKIPELDDFLQIKKLKKIRDTYLDAFYREQVDGIIHPFYNLHIARTFRSSSSNPNFQNIPIRDEESQKLCRMALFPRLGHQLMEVDFSGLEVHIAACYHKDPNMLKYINDPTTDMHRDMAIQIFKLSNYDETIKGYKTLRKAAKNGFVFPQFYGDYYKNCAENLAVMWGKLPETRWKSGEGIEIGDTHLSDHLISVGLKEYGVQKKINGRWTTTGFIKHLQEIEKDFWENRFSDYAQWKDDWYEKYLKKGYFDLYTGFRCSGVMSKNDVTNYPVQGAAFHCLLWSFIEIMKILEEEERDTKIIGQIHDSIILDVNPKELQHVLEVIKYVTEDALRKHWKWIIVPLHVDADICQIDEPWAMKKELKF